MGVLSCRDMFLWEMRRFTDPALPNSFLSLPRALYASHPLWLKQWIAFFVTWKEVFYYGWPQMECLSRDSARAECTGTAPWPNTPTNPTNWSEKKPSNCLIYPHFSMVRQLMHTSQIFPPCKQVLCFYHRSKYTNYHLRRSPELSTGEGAYTLLWDWALLWRGISGPQCT